MKCHPEHAVFLDTEIFKGPRLSTVKILNSQTLFKATETFQYTHFSSCHPLNTKKGFIKGETLRLLRTNSVKENFDKHKWDLQQRLCNRGCPTMLIHKIFTEYTVYRYIVSSLSFLFFLFYCNFWLNLESFYPVVLDMYFYLMSNKDHYYYYYYYFYYHHRNWSSVLWQNKDPL